MFLEPIYLPWALNTGTCIQLGDLFYSGPTQEPVLAVANTGKKLGEVLETMQMNGPEG